jgi:signal transduction histidine kinase
VRRQITLLVAATTTIVLLAFLLPAFSLVAQVAKANALDDAQSQLQFLLPSVGLETEDEIAAALGALDDGTDVGVRLPDRTWLGTPGTTGTPPASPAVQESDDGIRLIQPVDRDRQAAVIEIFVPRELLRAGVARTWAVLAGLGVVLLVLALLIADRLARSLTRPVTDLAATAHRLGNGDLSARATPAGPPEVREVGEAVNQLAGRIGELLVAEREAAADLAHRLRTPLTALQLDAEGLPPTDRERILDDVDALNRTVDAVIAEARRPVREGLGTGSDAAAVVADRVTFWLALAEDEGRPMDFQRHAGHLPVRVSADDLAAAVDALLGNVFAHTPDGTGLSVDVRPRDGGGARVTVADAGPGLDATAVERGRSGAGSTGLGLDIARRTAEASGGELRVASSARGTEVVLELGPPPH